MNSADRTCSLGICLLVGRNGQQNKIIFLIRITAMKNIKYEGGLEGSG